MKLGYRIEVLSKTLTKDISLKVHNATRDRLVHDKVWLYLCSKISKHTWRISVISRNIRL